MSNIGNMVLNSPGWDAWCRKNKDRQWMEHQPTYVYLISNGEKVKIGISVHPQKRITELQGGNAAKLSFLKLIRCENRERSFELESALHETLRDVHVQGEWYDIRELCKALMISEETAGAEPAKVPE